MEASKQEQKEHRKGAQQVQKEVQAEEGSARGRDPTRKSLPLLGHEEDLHHGAGGGEGRDGGEGRGRHGEGHVEVEGQVQVGEAASIQPHTGTPKVQAPHLQGPKED